MRKGGGLKKMKLEGIEDFGSFIFITIQSPHNLEELFEEFK